MSSKRELVAFFRKAALAHVCPSCGAPAGSPCSKAEARTGVRVQVRTHERRMQRAVACSIKGTR